MAAYAAAAAIFAGITILLVTLGVFAATSHLVAGRSRELAIRQAIGATPAQARKAVTDSILRWWACATAAGTGLSAAGMRLIAAAQPGLQSTAGLNIALGACAVTVALALASWVPLRQALRVEPASLMRGD